MMRGGTGGNAHNFYSIQWEYGIPLKTEKNFCHLFLQIFLNNLFVKIVGIGKEMPRAFMALIEMPIAAIIKLW